MDIEKLQIEIIGASIGEDQFPKVFFLLPEDFDLKFRNTWKKILESGGDIMLSFKDETIYNSTLVVSYSHIEILALKLLEIRFREYFEKTINHMISTSEDVSATIVLESTLKESKDQDVFDLIELTPDYLEPYADTHRLLNLKTYVKTRTNVIKEVYNKQKGKSKIRA